MAVRKDLHTDSVRLARQENAGKPPFGGARRLRLVITHIFFMLV